jgi:hypothetical protein
MYPISFPIKRPAGIRWMQRMGLDDNLAIAMVFNTTKQMYTDFKKTPFSGPHKIRKNDEKLCKK